jgi:hypothetical protein
MIYADLSVMSESHTGPFHTVPVGNVVPTRSTKPAGKVGIDHYTPRTREDRVYRPVWWGNPFGKGLVNGGLNGTVTGYHRERWYPVTTRGTGTNREETDMAGRTIHNGDESTRLIPNTDEGFVYGTHGAIDNEPNDFDPNVAYSTITGEYASFCYICAEIIPNSDITVTDGR